MILKAATAALNGSAAVSTMAMRLPILSVEQRNAVLNDTAGHLFPRLIPMVEQWMSNPKKNRLRPLPR